MTRRLGLAVGAAVGALVFAVLAGAVLGGEEVPVPPGSDLAALAAANPHATLVLEPGIHDGAVISERVTIQGRPDAEVLGPIEILADGVRLVDVEVRGGESGITIRDVEGVVLDGVRVLGAELHGIEAIDSVVHIRGCEVARLGSDQAQGIELRNGAGRGRSVIEGCTVDGGQEGIVTHVNRAEIVDNVVTGTTLRAVAIMEMSEVLATDNLVEDVVGAAYFCGDMSTCDLHRNIARRVATADNGIRSQSGQAAIVWYYSGLRLVDNEFDVVATPAVEAYQGGVLTDTSPLGVWPNGWTGILPAVPIALASLAGFGVIVVAVRAWLRRRCDQSSGDDRRWAVSELVYGLIVAGFAVQSFHMLEHFVQVVQVEVLDSEIRAGLIGQQFNVEWTHFLFNAAVLGFMIGVWKLGREATRSLSGASTAAAWFGAGIVAQSYHMLEHTAKIVQRIATRVDPAPGLFGDDLGLVWFHFAINLVVYVGLAVGVVAIVRERYREREQRRERAGEPVPA